MVFKHMFWYFFIKCIQKVYFFQHKILGPFKVDRSWFCSRLVKKLHVVELNGDGRLWCPAQMPTLNDPKSFENTK